MILLILALGMLQLADDLFPEVKRDLKSIYPPKVNVEWGY